MPRLDCRNFFGIGIAGGLQLFHASGAALASRAQSKNDRPIFLAAGGKPIREVF